MGYLDVVFCQLMLTIHSIPHPLTSETSSFFLAFYFHVFIYVLSSRALHVSMLYGGPAHVKLVAEWEPEIKARVFGVVPDQIPEPHQSVHDLRQIYQQPLNATLNDCLKIYTKEETVMMVKSCVFVT